jgi:hypothetical protein
VLRWTGPKVTLDAHLQRVREAAAAAATEAEAARVRQRIE